MVHSSRLQVLLCDLDGTLIDTVPLILQGYRHTLQAMGRSEVGDREIRRHLGKPLALHLAVWFQGPAELERSIAIYREHVLAAHDDMVHAFPKVTDALRECRDHGIRLGVVTSKTKAIALHGLEWTGLSSYFEFCVAAGETKRGKPHPDPLLHALRAMGATPDQAAQSGGLKPLVAGWGADRESLNGVGAHTWLDHPGQLLSAL